MFFIDYFSNRCRSWLPVRTRLAGFFAENPASFPTPAGDFNLIKQIPMSIEFAGDWNPGVGRIHAQNFNAKGAKVFAKDAKKICPRVPLRQPSRALR
jgi:hypothetical protein